MVKALAQQALAFIKHPDDSRQQVCIADRGCCQLWRQHAGHSLLRQNPTYAQVEGEVEGAGGEEAEA